MEDVGDLIKEPRGEGAKEKKKTIKKTKTRLGGVKGKPIFSRNHEKQKGSKGKKSAM